MTKAIKLAFAVIFWPVAIFLISKSIRGRILGGVSTLFYAYAIYHLSDRFFDDSATANAQHFIFYYQSVAEVVVALLLVLALIAVKTNSKSSREATSLGTRGKHIRGRIFKPFNKFGGLKTGSLLFGQHRIDPKILKTHAIVSGTTGSGKTQTLYPLIKYIVENNLKAIITDPKIEFSQKFMKNGDIVLSPFFKESAQWSPFAEIEDYNDCISIAHYLLPTNADAETETWNAYARDFLSDIFYCLLQENCRSVRAVLAFLRTPSLAKTLLKKHSRNSEGLFEEGSEKLLQNVRFVASQIAKSLEILSDEGTFSIKEWAKNPNCGVLWLPYSVQQRETLSKLLPLWISLGITGSMLPERVNSDKQTLFVLDELDSIGKIEKLPVLITEGRGYGLSAVLGFQNVGQITKRYKEEANSILSVVNNFFVLKQGAGTESAGQVNDSKFWSEFVGNEEIERVQRSDSTKGIDYHGSNQSKHIESVRIVTPEQLQALEARTGFVIFSGDIDKASGDGVVRDFKVAITSLQAKIKLTEVKIEPLSSSVPAPDPTPPALTGDPPSGGEGQAGENVPPPQPQPQDEGEGEPEIIITSDSEEDKYAKMAEEHAYKAEEQTEETEEQETQTAQTEDFDILVPKHTTRKRRKTH